jgi:hypothetical protein
LWGTSDARAIIRVVIVPSPLGPNQPFDAYSDGFAPGLVGTLTVTIYDIDGNVVVAETAADITEIAPIGETSRYGFQGIAPTPSDESQTFLLVWDDHDPDNPQSTSEEMYVSAGATPPTTGAPCGLWILGEDVADWMGLDYSSDTMEKFDAAAAAATEILFATSGRQFRGECGPVKVRPCQTGCGCWPWNETWHSWGQVSWGGGVPWWGGSAWTWGNGQQCGCAPLSQVTLAGVPVREIISVKVNGAFLASSAYRLDWKRYLVRMRDTADPDVQINWPGCQILDLPDTEAGTWAVTYTYGADPPESGILAAKELAAEIINSWGASGCRLPSGTTKVVRNAVTIDRQRLQGWIGKGGTGMFLVDAFLGSVNPRGLRRRPAVWSPNGPRYPRKPGG